MSESLQEVIVRLKKELNRARASRDRMEEVGQSVSFGGANFANVAYGAILTRISDLERQIYKAEALAEGLCVDPDLRVSRVSQY
jgi:hypothetical protein